MHVAQILNHKGRAVFTVAPTDSVRRAVDVLRTHNVGAVVVCDASGTVVGILSERDIVRAFADRGGQALDLLVQELMTRDVVTCKPEDTVIGLMSIMTEHRIRHLPVVEDGVLNGVVSIGDVVKFRLAEAQKELDDLRGYVMAQG